MNKLKNIYYFLKKILNKIVFFYASFIYKYFVYRFTVWYHKIKINYEWKYKNSEMVSYDHLNNLYLWQEFPEKVQFTISPAIARLYLKKNDTVLDVSCGDGSISYLFFSDIAKNVDAFDISEINIQKAKKNYTSKNLKYYCNSTLNFNYQEKMYDVIYWGAGIDYLSSEEIEQTIKKLRFTIKDSGYLIVKTVLSNVNSQLGPGMKTLFYDLENLFSFFEHAFNIEISKTSDYLVRKEVNIVFKPKIN